MSAPITVRPWMRPVYLLAGLVAFAVGVVGVFMPLIPTTGPMLLAAFFFARSSRRLHRWLVEHPRFGKFISDFQAGRGIPRRAKVTALVMMSIAVGVSAFVLIDNPVARWVTVAIGVIGFVYVLRVPSSD